MSKKHFELITAMNRTELAEKINALMAQGWQLQGDTQIASEPGVPWYLMQAMTGDAPFTEAPGMTTDDNGSAAVPVTVTEPEYYYVIPLAGQSNGMAYGEGLPLPDTYDKPDPRIKQLARRSTVTPGGEPCAYNDIIPADHCLHDVQDMSTLNHPNADISRGQYGCVGQGLHIAKKLLPLIPENAGILLVPCCRGGSAFTTGKEGSFSENTGASTDAESWVAGKALYMDLVSRTKAALNKNPKNVLLGVVWMMGEYDLKSQAYTQQPALFDAMVAQFRTDLTALSAQCMGGDPAGVPWICGDTTYHWKATYQTQYETVYGAYKNKAAQNIHFVPLATDENGANVPTNEPTEDPDITGAGYYGAASRSAGNWTTADRKTHFSAWARRGIIADRIATAMLMHAGRSLAFLTGQSAPLAVTAAPSSSGDTQTPAPQQPDSTQTKNDTPQSATTATRSLMSYLASSGDGSPESQGWTFSGGNKEVTTAEGATGGKAIRISKTGQSTWMLAHTATGADSLLKNGGRVSCRFKLEGNLVANQFAMAFYWHIGTESIPQGVQFADNTEGRPYLMAYFLQTDEANLNLMHHRKTNAKLGSFGPYNDIKNNWHELTFEFTAGSNMVTPVLNGTRGTPFSLAYGPAQMAKDSLIITDITKSATYGVLLERVDVEVNNTTA